MNAIRLLFLCSILLFPLTIASVVAEESSDQFEAMGWDRIGDPLEFLKKVASGKGSQKPVPLAQIDQPGITEANHLVAGMIRYEDVAGAAYLEMWTVYGEDERYFSRTLGDYGPMAKLAGSSEWRRVMLPFRGYADRHPVKLEINVVLPGGGMIEFKDFALYQSSQNRGGGWWAPGESIPGVGITTTIVLFSLGIALVLSTMGKARGLSVGLMIAVIVCGGLGLIGAAIAATTGQSPGIWAPLFACGALALIGGTLGFFIARRNYLKHELRRISAVDCTA